MNVLRANLSPITVLKALDYITRKGVGLVPVGLGVFAYSENLEFLIWAEM